MTNKSGYGIIITEREVRNMFRVIVAGTVIATYTTREEAERRLDEARHSFLAMVHPYDVFRIEEV